MKKILELSVAEKKIISIRKKGEDNFWCGYVKGLSDDVVVFQNYTRFGEVDGIVMEKIEHISTIEFDDEYTKTLAFMIQNRAAFANLRIGTIGIPQGEHWAFETLREFENTDILVSFEFNGINEFGFVKGVDYEHFTVQRVGLLGQDEGLGYYRCEDIKQMSIGTAVLRKAELLFRWKKGMEIPKGKG